MNNVSKTNEHGQQEINLSTDFDIANKDGKLTALWAYSAYQYKNRNTLYKYVSQYYNQTASDKDKIKQFSHDNMTVIEDWLFNGSGFWCKLKRPTQDSFQKTATRQINVEIGSHTFTVSSTFHPHIQIQSSKH